MVKVFLRLLALLFFLLVIYLLCWPVPFNPQSWEVPSSSFQEARFKVNGKLKGVTRIPINNGIGPETIATDSLNQLYTGLRNGTIIKLTKEGNIEQYGKTYTSAMGLCFDEYQNLIIADKEKGLVVLKPDGTLETILSEFEGKPFTFINDVKVANNGNYYFTESSTLFPLEESEAIFYGHTNTGRLFEYDINTKQTHLLKEGLYFPNGLDIDEVNGCILISETTRHQVARYYFKETKNGTHDYLIQNLPGYPTGISIAEDGLIWVALSSPRFDILDQTLPRPFLRKVMWRLPNFLKPAPEHYSFVLGLSASGEVLYNLQDDSENAYGSITSIKEIGNELFLVGGFETLWEKSIAKKMNPREE